MAIKHSPVKNLIFILISMWFGGFSALAAVDYLTSYNPYKDTSPYLCYSQTNHSCDYPLL